MKQVVTKADMLERYKEYYASREEYKDEYMQEAPPDEPFIDEDKYVFEYYNRASGWAVVLWSKIHTLLPRKVHESVKAICDAAEARDAEEFDKQLSKFWGKELWEHVTVEEVYEVLDKVYNDGYSSKESGLLRVDSTYLFWDCVDDLEEF